MGNIIIHINNSEKKKKTCTKYKIIFCANTEILNKIKIKIKKNLQNKQIKK